MNMTDEQIDRLKKTSPSNRLKVMNEIKEELDCQPETRTFNTDAPKALLSKYIPGDLEELTGDAINLYDMFINVHQAAYTGIGGLDIVVNNFNGNKVFFQFRDNLYSRFLCTYGAIVGRRFSDERRGKKNETMPEDIAFATMWNTVEDILFSMHRKPIPAQFYVDLIDVNTPDAVK